MSKESFKVKVGLAEMLKGGVIMDVTNLEQAKIAEDAGAVSVMALEEFHLILEKMVVLQNEQPSYDKRNTG